MMRAVAVFTKEAPELNQRLIEFQANVREELAVLAARRWRIIRVRTDYVAAPGELVEVDSSGGAVTVTFPVPSSRNAGLEIAVLRSAGSNTVNIVSPGADVGGVTDPLVSTATSNRFRLFISSGSAWRRHFNG
jgi:hypothetical protein